MMMDLTKLTARELRDIENNIGAIRRNAVKAGFCCVADELRAGTLKEMDIHKIAALTGMSALQAANEKNVEKADAAGLNKSWKTITKHYVCEEDGSRLTMTKRVACFKLKGWQ